MSAPPPIEQDPTNVLRLAQLAAVLRPAFRCPTTPVPLHELFSSLNGAVDGGTPMDAVEATLRSVIMLRNALEAGAAAPVDPATAPIDPATDSGGPSEGADHDVDTDLDPEIGLHLALFGVESLLARMGWTMQGCR